MLPKIYKRKQNDCYYVQLPDRKQVNLGRDKEKAEEQYKRIISRLDDYVTLPFNECADDFLEWLKQNKAPATFRFYQRPLESFCKTIGNLTIGKLKPHHVTQWATKGGPTYVNNRIRAVQRCCNWAVKQGYIDRSPLVGIEKPSPVSRDEYLTPQQFATVLGKIEDEAFRDFLIVLWETGCRPQEARTVEAKHLQDRRWVFGRQQRGKLKGCIVHLNDEAHAICQRYAAINPRGPIFRSAKGAPWKKATLTRRLARIDVPFPCSPYLIRHGFATRLLKAGVDPLTVSKLMNHKDTRMLERVYQHVDTDGDHLRAGLDKAKATSAVVLVSLPSPVDIEQSHPA